MWQRVDSENHDATSNVSEVQVEALEHQAKEATALIQPNNHAEFMKREQIVSYCVTKLKMTASEAEIVVDNVYIYDMPDWSEWSWRQINACFRGVLEAVNYVKEHGSPRFE